MHHAHSAACACHRVVQSSGRVGHYIDGGPLHKRQKLECEGVRFYGDRINLEHYGFEAFTGAAPLRRLRQSQLEAAKRVCVCAVPKLPDVVAGVDVSYASATQGVASYALVEVGSGALIWSACIHQAVSFPYISSYLAFRELPLHVALLAHVRKQGRLAPVVLVDGTGILHPRRVGIASHLGVLAEVPTVGVTKKRLCGQVNLLAMGPGDLRLVWHAGEAIGLAFQPKANVKPIYLSPGHKVDLAFVKALAPLLAHGHKLPEPLYWADRLSRGAVKDTAPRQPGLFS